MKMVHKNLFVSGATSLLVIVGTLFFFLKADSSAPLGMLQSSMRGGLGPTSKSQIYLTLSPTETKKSVFRTFFGSKRSILILVASIVAIIATAVIVSVFASKPHKESIALVASEEFEEEPSFWTVANWWKFLLAGIAAVAAVTIAVFLLCRSKAAAGASTAKPPTRDSDPRATAQPSPVKPQEPKPADTAVDPQLGSVQPAAAASAPSDIPTSNPQTAKPKASSTPAKAEPKPQSAMENYIATIKAKVQNNCHFKKDISNALDFIFNSFYNTIPKPDVFILLATYVMNTEQFDMIDPFLDQYIRQFNLESYFATFPPSVRDYFGKVAGIGVEFREGLRKAPIAQSEQAKQLHSFALKIINDIFKKGKFFYSGFIKTVATSEEGRLLGHFTEDHLKRMSENLVVI